MSLIRLNCPACARMLEIDEEAIGQEVQCGACFEVFVAPSSENPFSKSKETGATEVKLRKRNGKRASGNGHEFAGYGYELSTSSRRTGYDCERKSRIAFILFGVFLGNLGVHNFYAGRVAAGTAQLILTMISIPLLFFCIGFLTIWIPYIWALIEVAVIDEDADRVPMVA